MLSTIIMKGITWTSVTVYAASTVRFFMIPTITITMDGIHGIIPTPAGHMAGIMAGADGAGAPRGIRPITAGVILIMAGIHHITAIMVGVAIPIITTAGTVPTTGATGAMPCTLTGRITATDKEGISTPVRSTEMPGLAGPEPLP